MSGTGLLPKIEAEYGSRAGSHAVDLSRNPDTTWLLVWLIEEADRLREGT
jgi:hypothetical protein